MGRPSWHRQPNRPGNMRLPGIRASQYPTRDPRPIGLPHRKTVTLLRPVLPRNLAISSHNSTNISHFPLSPHPSATYPHFHLPVQVNSVQPRSILSSEGVPRVVKEITQILKGESEHHAKLHHLKTPPGKTFPSSPRFYIRNARFSSAGKNQGVFDAFHYLYLYVAT